MLGLADIPLPKIDLTISQIVDPPVTVWVRDKKRWTQWVQRNLVEIDHSKPKPFRVKCHGGVFKYKICSLEEPA